MPRHSVFMMVSPSTEEHSLNWEGGGAGSVDGNGKEGPEQMEQIENNVSVTEGRDAPEACFINNKDIIVIYQFLKIISQCAGVAFLRRRPEFGFQSVFLALHVRSEKNKGRIGL